MGKNIVLGLSDNIDYEICLNSAILEEMILENGIFSREIGINKEITSVKSLILSILGFLGQGTGGEKLVASTEIIECFAAKFEKKITLGGTAVRSAIVMSKLGFSSAVHLVTMNEQVSRLLPPDCEYLCSNPETSSYPHLIIQYHKGIKINANDIYIETKRSNRIIYVYDQDNAFVRLHPGLAGLLSSAKVFLISGFNAMHNPSLLEERLRQLMGYMTSLPQEAVVFYENACFHYPEMQALVLEKLVPMIDIFSQNEDELYSCLGKQVPLTDACAVAEALKLLEKRIPVPVLILHTRYWALAYGADAIHYKNALLGGVIMATTRFLLGDDFTRQDYEQTGHLPVEKEGTEFACELQTLLKDKVCCIPSFQVLETKVTTIGLGDSFVGGAIPMLL